MTFVKRANLLHQRFHVDGQRNVLCWEGNNNDATWLPGFGMHNSIRRCLGFRFQLPQGKQSARSGSQELTHLFQFSASLIARSVGHESTRRRKEMRSHMINVRVQPIFETSASVLRRLPEPVRVTITQQHQQKEQRTDSSAAGFAYRFTVSTVAAVRRMRMPTASSPNRG
jgi:hypothetical protein